MKLVIEMNLDNEAFSEDPCWEIGRILNHVSQNRLPCTVAPTERIPLRNSNGNTVGYAEIRDE